MRLALRDLFWLALLVAGATFWWGEHRNALKERREWRRHSWFFRSGPRDPSHSDRERMAAVEGFSRFTNQELDDHYTALMASDRQRYAFDREPCLLEMAHRGMSEELQRHYDEWLAHRPVMQQYSSFFPNNLELLTALRRAQQQPDPLRIDVAVLEESATAGSKAPLVRVTHTNVDSGEQSFHHKVGGDYLEKTGAGRSYSPMSEAIRSPLQTTRRCMVGDLIHCPAQHPLRRRSFPTSWTCVATSPRRHQVDINSKSSTTTKQASPACRIFRA